jgi:hypothetical protein
VDSSGNLDNWWSASGSGVWHEQQVAAAAGGVSYQDPAVAWAGSAELITAVDNVGDLDNWWSATGSGTWNKQRV